MKDCVNLKQLTQALEEATEFVCRLIDVQTKLDGKERQRLWTHGRHQHLVLRHVTLLMGTENRAMSSSRTTRWLCEDGWYLIQGQNLLHQLQILLSNFLSLLL